MSTLIKSAAVALLSLGLVAGAQAARPSNIVVSTLDASVAAPGSFSQVFEFVTGSTYNPSFGSIFVSGQNSLFSALNVEIFPVVGDSLFGPITGSASSGLVKAGFSDKNYLGDLAANTAYRLVVTGVSSAPSVSYGIQGVFVSSISQISVVPEPASYAMLLAGIGVISSIAFRRSRQG